MKKETVNGSVQYVKEGIGTMKTSTKKALILAQMVVSVPRNALGYIADLQSTNATPAIIEDRLNMLARYVPGLVAEYREVN